MKYEPVTNYIHGQPVASRARRLDVVSPVDGSHLSTVPLCTSSELDSAARAAADAFPGWSSLTIRDRAEVFYRYRQLLQSHGAELSQLIREENGKTLVEAQAEIDKAIELTELACSLPHLLAGEVLEVSRGFHCSVQREPLGIVASVTPFNFPSMVPHWTIPLALALGNTMILKPSEKVPMSANRIGQLLQEAGLPDGAFNVVHGDRELVEAICDHPRIVAVTFVGSTPAAKSVYIRATAHLKRVLAMGGAKNHLIVMPDADPEYTATDIATAVCGCAGQRCMAAATMVAVGHVDSIIDAVVTASKRWVPGDNLGAVISGEARARIESLITQAEQQGARVLLDGRRTVVAGKEKGSYVGPTVIDQVTTEMPVAQAEVFGPVLSIIRARDLAEALQIENASPYGNAAVVYTQDGQTACQVAQRASAGMIGINVGVPVPREPFGFGGWNDSRFGVGEITGKSAIHFWTQSKKITAYWGGASNSNRYDRPPST